MKVVQASRRDHDALVKLARSSRYTRDFSNHMFSGESAYEKGWIRKLVGGGKLLGFTCVRHKVRQPETTLYFIAIDPDHKRKGLGTLLLQDLMNQTPHGRIVLNVMKDNEEARSFYRKHRFTEEGEALKGEGVKLVWTSDRS